MGTLNCIGERLPLGILGTGGHGRELAWIARGVGIRESQLRFILDTDFASNKTVVDGSEVMLARDFSDAFPASSVIIGIGNGLSRASAARRFKNLGHFFPKLVARDSLVAESAKLAEGVVLFPGTSVSVGVSLGEHVHINAQTSISHDVEIGSFSTLAPRVTVCGYVKIGVGATLGAGCTIRNGTAERPLYIGDGAMVGMGAVVTSDVEPGSRVFAAPAAKR